MADPGIPKRGCGTGGLEDGSLPAGSRGGAPVGVWGRSPQKLRTLCDIHNSQQSKTSIQRHIQHDKNRTNLAQEIKLVWSKRTCQRLRQVRLASFAHVRGLAPMMSAANLSLTIESMSLAV